MKNNNVPSMDKWMEEAKAHDSAPHIGMYLIHNGVVRRTSRAEARGTAAETAPVAALDFSCDRSRAEAAAADTYMMPGIYYIKTWFAEGRLDVGDDIMYVLIGGDTRPHTEAALQYLVGRIKDECVSEKEIYGGR